MPAPERVGSNWALTRARDYETPMHVFLREAHGLTRTGYICRILDLHTERAERLVVAAPERRGHYYPLHAGDDVEFFFEIDGVGFAFAAVVQERVQYPLNEQREVPALRMSYPPDVLKIQRRSYYRAMAAPAPPIPVKLRERPEDETEEDRMFATDYPYLGEMVDISGAGIAVYLDAPLPFEPEINTALTVAFRLTESDPNDIVLATIVRGITEPSQRDGTLLHLAWVDLNEDDDVTGPLATRIFRYVADRQRLILQERHSRLRQRR